MYLIKACSSYCKLSGRKITNLLSICILKLFMKLYWILSLMRNTVTKKLIILLKPTWKDIFFTPIPCTYTSSPLDGMARNYIYIFFISMDTQDHAIYRVWIHFVSTSLYPRRRKTFGLSWNQTQILLLHKWPL